MRVQSTNREFWYAVFAVLGITTAYMFVVLWYGGVPRAREFFGHSLGILGFLLMLMTETLYSLRKRSRRARWGRMSSWLEFHIFTGLVGPYLVLLHTSWKFNGLAGIVMLMTLVVVASGFIGRYIYTVIPRTADGVEIESQELERQFNATETKLRNWLSAHPRLTPALAQLLTTQASLLDNHYLMLRGKPFSEWSYRLQLWFEKWSMDSATRAQVNQMEGILRQQRTLRRQLTTLSQARRLLALWHSVHIPIGMALFTSAVIHIGAAIYY